MSIANCKQYMCDIDTVTLDTGATFGTIRIAISYRLFEETY